LALGWYIKSHPKTPTFTTTTNKNSYDNKQNTRIMPLPQMNWTLIGCCRDTEEIVFLCLYAGYTIMTYFLMETPVVKPLKLIAIFIHEMGQYVNIFNIFVCVFSCIDLRGTFILLLLLFDFFWVLLILLLLLLFMLKMIDRFSW